MSVKKSLIRFGMFAALSILATVIVVSTLINPVSGPSSQYQAVFVNASGLVTGSDVQIAGVRVGRVESVELVNNQAVVGFQLESTQRIPTDGRAVVRYADLLGARTISIESGPDERATGEPATGNYLPPGATIPVEQTQPAIDLTDILGGFRPLFDALDPAEVNELAGHVVQVFQGQGSTIESLLERTVAVTENLTSCDAILDQLLTNLDRVLTVTTTNRPNFVEMINTLDTLVVGLAQDRQHISAAVDSAGALTSSLQDLVTRVEPDLTGTLTSIDQSARAVVDNRDSLATGITAFDQLFSQLGIAMSYGSWANIYICNFQLSALGQSVSLGGPERSAVCR
ncbi:MCE family protein [Rhodococcus sp. GB-02]